jgi:hypothetical protein
MAVYFENHTVHKHTLCVKNVELTDVRAGATYSYHWALNQ